MTSILAASFEAPSTKDFVYGDARIHSAALETWARDRVLRVCSFSKAYAMTGWRVGFLHGPSHLVADVLKVHDALVCEQREMGPRRPRDPLEPKLSECPPGAGDRLVPVPPPDDQLRDQRVVEWRDRVAWVDGGVDPYAWPAG